MDAMKYSLEADKYRSSYPTLPSSSLAMSAMYNAVANPSSGPPTSGSDSATTTTPTPPASTATTSSTSKFPENLSSSSSPPPKPNYLDPLGRNYLDTKAYFDSSKLYLQEHAKYADPSRYEFMAAKYPTEGSTGSRSPTTPEIKADDSPSSVSPPSAGLLSYYHHHQGALPPGLIPMSQYAAAVAGHHYHLHAAAAAAAASATGSASAPSGPSTGVSTSTTSGVSSSPTAGSTPSGAEFRRPLTVIF